MYSLPLSTVAPHTLQLQQYAQHNITSTRNYKTLVANHLLMHHLPSQLQQLDIMKADSGASKTYLQLRHVQYLLSSRTLINGPTATLPDNTKIKASTQSFLPLCENLMLESLVYPSLNNESLLSIGQLCD